MRQKLFEYLAQRPGGATSSELLHLLFPFEHSSVRTPEVSARILNATLGADPHFSYDSTVDRWRLTTHEALLQPGLHAPFTIIAIETTGVNPGVAGITELAALRIESGRLTKEFHTLINPGRRIPLAISRLTGITDDIVRDQPTIDAIFPQLRLFLGSSIVVAHNADFDFGFLNVAARHLLSSPLLNLSICTARLAKRLLPNLHSHSLDVVASHLGVANAGRHRALGDARMTAEILLILLEKAETLGIRSVGELLDFQYSARDGRRFECFISRSFLTNLPDKPGVYRLLDGERRLLYIGKAKNLRRRVSSYFTNSSGHSDKVLELVRKVREVAYELTGSALEAALREATLIRALKPPYNTLAKHLPRVAFLKLTHMNPYPRLAITSKPGADRSLYIGPFRSRQFAERAQRLLVRLFGLRTCQANLQPDPAFSPCVSGQIGACTAPCNESVTREAYETQVNAFLRFLTGQDSELRETLGKKRDRLAAALRFEGAARVQQDLQLLEQIVQVHSRWQWLVTRAHALLLLPSCEPGAAQAYLVLNGRLIANPLVRSRQDLMPLVTLVQERFTQDQDRPLRPEEIDSSVILAAWLRDPDRSQGAVFPIEGPSTLEERIDEIDLALQDLQRLEDLAHV